MLAIEDIMRYRREQKGGEISHENLIKIIHKSIREKIQDLTRPYRNKNLANINLANVEIFDENMQQLEIVKIESGADHGLAE
ncbi:hypothetical protein RN001_009531 [Aquatica leii]|uniref:Uncharacterized protein n=1 Tax=Aquatica leii TaxID=1421715 RepID=A0AAN7Q2J3_9COLE|nr:hypothetical protein RN001_009531 [Aquatica leii]